MALGSGTPSAGPLLLSTRFGVLVADGAGTGGDAAPSARAAEEVAPRGGKAAPDPRFFPFTDEAADTPLPVEAEAWAARPAPPSETPRPPSADVSMGQGPRAEGAAPPGPALPAPPGPAFTPGTQLPSPPPPAVPGPVTTSDVQAVALSQASADAPAPAVNPATAGIAPETTAQRAASPAPTPTSIAPPAPAEQVARAVAVAPGERVVEVRLDPPQLGRVRVEFDFTGDAVRAVVSAAEPEALSLLRRGQAGLVRDLAEMGYEGAEVEYAEDRPPGRGREEEASYLPASFAPGAGPAAADEAPRPRPRRHDGALDITL